MQIASYIDHTILKPNTTIAEIEQLCMEAVEYGFAAVCIPPPFVKRASALLEPTTVKISTVIGFPFGYSATESKIAETVLALVDGAGELDVVQNLIALRDHNWQFLQKEAELILDIAHQKKCIVKFILETGLLTDEEIIKCCTLYGQTGADFVKTSTGYAEKGASVEVVQLMRKHLPSSIKIKASGGIRNYEMASKLVKAGADRLGCSSSVKIVKEASLTRN